MCHNWNRLIAIVIDFRLPHHSTESRFNWKIETTYFRRSSFFYWRFVVYRRTWVICSLYSYSKLLRRILQRVSWKEFKTKVRRCSWWAWNNTVSWSINLFLLYQKIKCKRESHALLCVISGTPLAYHSGREFGLTSLEIHFKTCKNKWDATRAMPEPPSELNEILANPSSISAQ